MISNLDPEQKSEQLRFALVLLYVFSLPFNLFYSSILFIVLCALTLLTFNLNKIKAIPRKIWIFQMVFIISALGYTYSCHKHDAGFLLERQLTILLFPLILPLAVTFSESRLRATLLTLSVSCFAVITYLFLHMGVSISKIPDVSFIKAAFSGAFFNHQFSKPINLHAGYLSLYTGFSIVNMFVVFKRQVNFALRAVIVVMLLILFAGLFFLASRNAIISTFFVIIFLFPIWQVKHKIFYYLVTGSIVLSAFLLVQSVPYLKSRFSVQFISDIKSLPNGTVTYSATEPRIERWKCALSLIQQSPLYGYGTGDEVSMLKERYASAGLFISYWEEFNAHNTYLSYLIKHGIIGLLALLITFGYYLRLAIKNKDVIYLAFLSLMLFGFYTENLLDANKGIVFFAFFNTLLGYHALQSLSGKRTNL